MIKVIGTHPFAGTRAYVAGPMTGIPEYNYPAFYQAKDLLLELGLVPVIPPELCPFEEGLNYTDYFKADVEGMLTCQIQVLLPGWTQSPGARAEMTLAAAMRMPTYFLIPGQALLVCMDNALMTPPSFPSSEIPKVHTETGTSQRYSSASSSSASS